jgi:PAS domain S-box-containing protein
MSLALQKTPAQHAPEAFEQTQLLFQLATAVSHAQDPSEIYHAAVEGLVRLLGADRAGVRVFDPDGVLRFKAWIGLTEQFRAAVEMLNVWRQGLQDAVPVVVVDTLQDGPLSRYRPSFSNEGIRAVAFIPLLGRSGVMGKFMLYYDRPHDFSLEELRLAQMIAAHVAFATERRNTEMALRMSEEQFRAIFAQASVGIAQVDLDGKYTLVNERYCAILGYTQAELRERTPLGIIHREDREAIESIQRRMMAGELSSDSKEIRYVRNDGTLVWAKLHVSAGQRGADAPQYLVHVLEDVTERVEAERALLESQQALALAQSAARLGTWWADLRTNETTYSADYARLHGLPPGRNKLTHEEWLSVIHPDDRERMQSALNESHERTHSWDDEVRVVWPDGSVHWLLGKGQVYLDDNGQPVRMAGVSLDITERKQAEAALRESEGRFRALADSAPVMMWVAGPDRQFTFFNKTLLDFVGRTLEQEMNDRWVGSIHPEDVDRCTRDYRAAFEAREPFQIEHRLHRADGEYRRILCSGVPRFAPGGAFAGYIGSGIDITDLRRTQEEAFERQKLESLGVLTGGIAHDFNNLLGSILVNAEMAEAGGAGGEGSSEPIEKIKTVAIRAAEIVRELMIYSGQDKADLGPVDVTGLVEEMLELLKISISKQATLTIDLGRDLPTVQGNSAQIRQVVMNLLLNASEAIGDRSGEITVCTSFVSCGTAQDAGRSSKVSGDCIRLRVSDTGCGMTGEQQARIFEPFFTTKFSGRGLGLAVVHGIVRAHGGAIKVTSSPGDGTAFDVFLPCARQAARPDPRVGASAPAEDESNSGRVLVVEDEEALRTAVSRLLRKKGFAVLEAGNGTDAIDLLREQNREIDVMLLDLTIPGASSLEVALEVHRIRPDLKIVLTSAYGESASQQIKVPEVSAFIRKPFQIAELVNLLREMSRPPERLASQVAD